MASLNPITPRTIARSNMFVLLFSFNYVHCTLNLLRNAISNRGGSSTLPQHSQAIPASHPSSALQGIIADGAQHNIHQSTAACPYHSQILALRLARHSTDGMSALGRYIETPIAELPMTLCANIRVGSASSAGCTCGQIPQEVIDNLTREAICDPGITPEDTTSNLVARP
ncbi:hypothetical protein BU26DRAFT_548719 [Trematosphaeria pertusa]|uniref:Uncharacterized protein n=1 Tax=Trematosphaeria pertusa TaxID=390896 RepID=A0A6A6IP41_9PLEO|nr:uncharacterized protein BU26DRAFT_548719 [Trematosphaeria pertusa]KAF2251987.1 hypothetical protein BU26DRAFT_548719 [Trematosphaeria pertusa]